MGTRYVWPHTTVKQWCEFQNAWSLVFFLYFFETVLTATLFPISLIASLIWTRVWAHGILTNSIDVTAIWEFPQCTHLCLKILWRRNTQKNVNRNKHWQRYIYWDGKYAVNRPYPAFFLTNSVYHLNDVILLMLFFITSNHFPFKKKHRRASNTTDVVFSERVDKMHFLPSKYPYVTPF